MKFSLHFPAVRISLRATAILKNAREAQAFSFDFCILFVFAMHFLPSVLAFFMGTLYNSDNTNIYGR